MHNFQGIVFLSHEHELTISLKTNSNLGNVKVNLTECVEKLCTVLRKICKIFSKKYWEIQRGERTLESK